VEATRGMADSQILGLCDFLFFTFLFFSLYNSVDFGLHPDHGGALDSLLATGVDFSSRQAVTCFAWTWLPAATTSHGPKHLEIQDTYIQDVKKYLTD